MLVVKTAPRYVLELRTAVQIEFKFCSDITNQLIDHKSVIGTMSLADYDWREFLANSSERREYYRVQRIKSEAASKTFGNHDNDRLRSLGTIENRVEVCKQDAQRLLLMLGKDDPDREAVEFIITNLSNMYDNNRLLVVSMEILTDISGKL